MRRMLMLGIISILLAACSRQNAPSSSLMTYCSINQTTFLGNVELEIEYTPKVSLDVSVTQGKQVSSASQPGQVNKDSVVKGYFEIYTNATMVEVQDSQSGALFSAQHVYMYQV